MTRKLIAALGLVLSGPAWALQACAQATLASHLDSGRWLRVLATNDFHGALEPRRDGRGTLRGGASTLAAEIALARAECRPPACRSILLDGGDQFQGSPASNLSHGRPVVEVFNRLDRAASALGNHELDWGQDTLRALMREARWAILAANVVDLEGRDVDWIPNDTIVALDGVRVGIVGIASPGTARMSKPEHVVGLRFVNPAQVVDAHARSLRARGADVVLVVAHVGATCGGQPPACDGEIIDFATSVRERIDGIVSGHTHSPVATVIRGVPIVQARVNGTALGVMDIPLEGGEPVIALRDVLPERTAPDPGVDSLVRDRVAPILPLVQRPIAEIAERMTRDEVGDLIADAQRAAGGGDVAVMNRGGVRAAIDSGTATYGSLFEVAPFANTLVRITLPGSALRRYLERIAGRGRQADHLSGVVVTVDLARRSGSRITSVRMSDGREFDPAASYRLVMSDFMASGGDGLQVSEGADRVEALGIVDLDALIAWLRAQPSPVRPPTDRRIVSRSP
jgi:2',3'-cyclic-nucleotide 2'-phosphodiesterase (5'-nucleotidase family)